MSPAPRRAATGPDSPANPAFPPGIDCYMPANGETATVSTNPSVPVDISLNLLKREMALGGAWGPLEEPRDLPAPADLLPVFQGLFLIPKSLAPCTEP